MSTETTMANYTQHTCLNLAMISLIGLTLNTYSIISSKLLIIATTGFVFATFYLSPDLDLSYSKPSKNWGPWKFIWWPYTWIFRHRGLSHHYTIGTLSRVIYLYLIACLILTATKGASTVIEGKSFKVTCNILSKQFVTIIEQSATFSSKYYKEMIALIIGVFLSDLIHILVDERKKHIKSIAKKFRLYGS